MTKTIPKRDKKTGQNTTIYTEALADEICLKLMAGQSLRSICREMESPRFDTVLKWLAKGDHPFQAKYEHARRVQAEILVDDINEIADDGRNDYMERLDAEGNVVGWQVNGEHIQRSRLRVDSRKWGASKILKSKYGDSKTVEMTGKGGGPIKQEIAAMNPMDAYAAMLGDKDIVPEATTKH